MKDTISIKYFVFLYSHDHDLSVTTWCVVILRYKTFTSRGLEPICDGQYVLGRNHQIVRLHMTYCRTIMFSVVICKRNLHLPVMCVCTCVCTCACTCVCHCVPAQVLLELTRQADQENTVLALSVTQLGAEGKMRTYDLSITSYLRKVGLDYCEIRGGHTHTNLVL